MSPNRFFKLVALAAVIVAGLIFAIVGPVLNEDSIHAKLNASFEDFRQITKARFPDLKKREEAEAKILAEKDRVTNESAWPGMVCTARFMHHNPGTVHRLDKKYVTCNWKFQ